MWWARVKEIINSRNENSENPSRVQRGGFVAEKYIDSWYAICAKRRHPRGVIGKINNPRYIAVCRNGKRLIRLAAHWSAVLAD